MGAIIVKATWRILNKGRIKGRKDFKQQPIYLAVLEMMIIYNCKS